MTAKTEKVTPTYLEPGNSFKMGIHDVFRALKVIEKHKQMNKFFRASKQRTLPSASVPIP